MNRCLKKKRIFIYCLILIIVLMPWKSVVLGLEPEIKPEEEIERTLMDQISELELSEWETLIDELKQEGENPLIPTNIKGAILDILKGNYEFSLGNTFKNLISIMFKELSLNISFLVRIIAISLIAGILGNFGVSFNTSSTGEIGWLVSYILMVTLIIGSISTILNIGISTIDRMTDFMQIIFPILLAMLIAIGGVSSSAILSPTTAILTGFMGQFIRNIIIPLILISITLVIISNINKRIKLDGLSSLTKSLCSWLLGIVFTVFIGILSIQGALSASFDGISIRTTKYAIEAFVPVVGKMFSQTVDIIIGCSLMLRNALGVVGLITLTAICLYPAIKIMSLILVYRLCGGLLEPIADKRIINCLKGLGDILVIFFVAVVGTAIMFFLTIALLIVIGNITIMMR